MSAILALDQNNKPVPNQPNIVGEFYLVDGKLFCKCGTKAELQVTPTDDQVQLAVRCVNNTCPQFPYRYEPLQVYLSTKAR